MIAIPIWSFVILVISSSILIIIMIIFLIGYFNICKTDNYYGRVFFPCEQGEKYGTQKRN